MGVQEADSHFQLRVAQTIQDRGRQVQRAQRIAPLDGTVRRDDRRRVEHVSERRAHGSGARPESLQQNGAPLVPPLMRPLLDYVCDYKRPILVRAMNGGVALLVRMPVVVRERVSERLWQRVVETLRHGSDGRQAAYCEPRAPLQPGATHAQPHPCKILHCSRNGRLIAIDRHGIDGTAQRASVPTY